MIASLAQMVQQLQQHGVRFIVIGGWAAIIHGTARSTNDVDVVYARDAENIERLAQALTPWHPYLRGAPPGLPFRWDPATIRAGLNFTLTTDYGHLDVLGEVTGVVLTNSLFRSRKKRRPMASVAAWLPWSGSSSSSALRAGRRIWKLSPNCKRS
jgi:hypothetical protein